MLGGLTRRKLPSGKTVVIFRSGSDLVRKTPAFYRNAVARLDEQLHRAYRYAEVHFHSRRVPYIDEMNKNVNDAEALTDAPLRQLLRRQPPSTLLPSVLAFPKDLVIV